MDVLMMSLCRKAIKPTSLALSTGWYLVNKVCNIYKIISFIGRKKPILGRVPNLDMFHFGS